MLEVRGQRRTPPYVYTCRPGTKPYEGMKGWYVRQASLVSSLLAVSGLHVSGFLLGPDLSMLGSRADKSTVGAGSARFDRHHHSSSATSTRSSRECSTLYGTALSQSKVEITPEMVRKTAVLAQIQITDEEVDALVPRMEEFIGFVETMGENDADDSAFATLNCGSDFLREDAAESFSNIAAVMDNMPVEERNYLRVPKVGEDEGPSIPIATRPISLRVELADDREHFWYHSLRIPQYLGEGSHTPVGMGSQEREGIGAHNMWGYAPAQDLLRDARLQGEANILICQPGDIGHLLRTIGSRRRHPQHTINLYVWESQMEVVARHLLLLQVAQDWELPIRQKANVLLEIFGNCLVQGRTSRYIARLGKELENMLFETTVETDMVDLSLLKCRQKDQLGEAFKSWGYDVPCNMKNLRDSRLRKFFGGRYDHRKNLVDWDYTNRLKEVASIIHHTQYRGWRLEGIAYEIGDQVYEQPNRTMISYAEGMMVKGQHRGLKKEMRGFWLDIRVGPFIPFGVECDRPNAYAEELFAILNKGTGTEQHRHNTAEVAVYSVITYLWGLETRGQYTMTKKNDIYSGLGEDCNTPESKEPKESDTQSEHEEQHRKGVETTTDTQHVDGGGTQGSNANDKKNSGGASGDSACHLAQTDYSGDAVRPPQTDDRTKATSREQARARAQCIMETFDGVKVFMLSGDLNQHLAKPRFRGLFDRVHMSLTAVDLAGSDGINSALADDAVITMDTARYMVPFNKEQQRTFIGKACSLACERGWEPLFDSDCSSDGKRTPAKEAELSMDHLGFSFNRKPAYA